MHRSSLATWAHGILRSLDTFSFFKDLEEKFKYKIQKLYLKKVNELKHVIITTVWEDMLECFCKTREKSQTPGLDILDGNLFLDIFNLFIKELREYSNTN